MSTAHLTEPEIGCWYSICCHLDLCKIADESDIEWVEAQRNYGCNVSVWETKRDALLKIRIGTQDAASLTEIDTMLADLGEV